MYQLLSQKIFTGLEFWTWDMCKAKIFLDRVAFFNFSNFHQRFENLSKFCLPFQLQVLITFSVSIWHSLNLTETGLNNQIEISSQFHPETGIHYF